VTQQTGEKEESPNEKDEGKKTKFPQQRRAFLLRFFPHELVRMDEKDRQPQKFIWGH